VADKCVATVVDGQGRQSLGTEHLAGGAEAFPQCVAREARAAAVGNERGVALGSLVQPVGLPGSQIGQRPCVPPERNHPRFAALSGPTADSQVRAGEFNAHVCDLKLGNLADPQAAAGGYLPLRRQRRDTKLATSRTGTAQISGEPDGRGAMFGDKPLAGQRREGTVCDDEKESRGRGDSAQIEEQANARR
jgi:hypothetical protein